MQTFLVLCVLAVCLARWMWLHGRLQELETRISVLERQGGRAVVPETPVAPERRVVAPPHPEARPLPRIRGPEPPPMKPEPEARPARDWEAVVGGNWLNKLGVFILVIGIALALGYSFTRVGPAGRVAISLCASFAMLGGGAALESRYRVFARGLLGGGWSALYFTVYAMHAVEAARVVYNPYLASALLLAVAAGMIGHSLRYRSETVTGLAYVIAFVTLAIAEPNGFAVVALLPLAVSLLYVARRFQWRTFALIGVVGTYATVALRGDTGAPLWQTQAVLAAFWLIFEAFDLMVDGAALLPLNAGGFLWLSIAAWQSRMPDEIWRFAAAAAIVYAASAGLRSRSAWWPAAATLSAILAAAAILLRCEAQWTAVALVIEAEAVYLAGVRLRAPFLRHLGTAVFALAVARLVVADVPQLPAGSWVPVALLAAVMFYGNSFVDRFHSYAGAALLALVAGYEAPYDRGLAWTLLGAAAFAIGFRCRRFDFRAQSYGLAVLGIIGFIFASPLHVASGHGHFPVNVAPRVALAIAAALVYAAALAGRFSRPLDEAERRFLRSGASLAATGLLASVAWQSVTLPWTGIAWLALGAILLELGVRDLPGELRRPALALAAIGTFLAFLHNVMALTNAGPWMPRVAPLIAAAATWFISFRSRRWAIGWSVAGSVFLAAAAWSALPAPAVAPVWGGIALGMLRLNRREGWLFAAAAAVRSLDPAAAVVSVAIVVLLLHAMRRAWPSLAGSLLLAVLLFHRVSGSLLTMVWGAEGIVLLAAGFPLRDRVLRLSGLGMLLFCILKAFVYDLRYLETLPRIFSFLVLGLILVTVSGIYARFRDRVQKLL